VSPWTIGPAPLDRPSSPGGATEVLSPTGLLSPLRGFPERRNSPCPGAHAAWLRAFAPIRGLWMRLMEQTLMWQSTLGSQSSAFRPGLNLPIIVARLFDGSSETVGFVLLMVCSARFTSGPTSASPRARKSRTARGRRIAHAKPTQPAFRFTLGGSRAGRGRGHQARVTIVRLRTHRLAATAPTSKRSTGDVAHRGVCPEALESWHFEVQNPLKRHVLRNRYHQGDSDHWPEAESVFSLKGPDARVSPSADPCDGDSVRLRLHRGSIATEHWSPSEHHD
jgi:hypothetical protein